jgi:hypothetical protein
MESQKVTENILLLTFFVQFIRFARTVLAEGSIKISKNIIIIKNLFNSFQTAE